MLFLCVAFRITLWLLLSNFVSISIFNPLCLPVTLYLCRSASSPPFFFLLRQCEWNALTTGLTFLKSTHAPNQQHSICIGSLLSLCNIFTFFSLHLSVQNTIKFRSRHQHQLRSFSKLRIVGNNSL